MARQVSCLQLSTALANATRWLAQKALQAPRGLAEWGKVSGKGRSFDLERFCGLAGASTIELSGGNQVTWKKGESGNPTGKPAGARNKATVMVLKIMETWREGNRRGYCHLAKGGDMTAARLVLERLVPPAKERPIFLALPSTETADGIAEAQQAILQAVAAGDLLPGEGATMAGIVEARRKAVETLELEQRITALEGKK
jgi:hypothetical protein